MYLNLEMVVGALNEAARRHNPDARVVVETDVDASVGQTYRMQGTTYHDQRLGQVFQVNAHGSVYAEFPEGFAVYEIEQPQAIDAHTTAFTIRVGKIGEAEKQRIRVTADGVEVPLPASHSLRDIYTSLRKLDDKLPEYNTLSEAKLKIFISQIVTLRMTMKM